MGEVLYDYFTKAGKVGGVKARTKLSYLTKTSSLQSKSLKDSPENIEKFENAIEKIYEDYAESMEKLAIKKSEFETQEDKTTRLSRYLTALVDLAAQRALYLDNLTTLFHRITETIAYTMEIERVSIWYTGNDGIICKDLFEQSKGKHSKDNFLAEKDYPNYFKAIKLERTLPANDANKDKRTKEFSESYLKPNGITSMLDVPIWVNGKMVGIICHEHVGSKREWTTDEENFAYLMGNILAIAIESDLRDK